MQLLGKAPKQLQQSQASGCNASKQLGYWQVCQVSFAKVFNAVCFTRKQILLTKQGLLNLRSHGKLKVMET